MDFLIYHFPDGKCFSRKKKKVLIGTCWFVLKQKTFKLGSKHLDQTFADWIFLKNKLLKVYFTIHKIYTEKGASPCF